MIELLDLSNTRIRYFRPRQVYEPRLIFVKNSLWTSVFTVDQGRSGRRTVGFPALALAIVNMAERAHRKLRHRVHARRGPPHPRPRRPLPADHQPGGKEPRNRVAVGCWSLTMTV